MNADRIDPVIARRHLEPSEGKQSVVERFSYRRSNLRIALRRLLRGVYTERSECARNDKLDCSSFFANIRTIFFIVIILTILACNLGSLIATAPTPTSAPTQTLTVLRVTATPPRVAPSAPPAWWDKQIAMPPGAEFVGDTKRAAWRTGDTSTDGIRDFILRQAMSANYQSIVITQSQGAIYDVLLVKGQSAYAVNVTLGSDTTIITAERVGVMHLQVSGVVNIEVDLPLRGRIDTTPGSEVSIGTSIPNSQCPGCQYFINVHIAPFKGAGNYDSKPGISIIDVELVPGGDYERDNYRWAQSCTVTVKETSGSFDCRGLQNKTDTNQKVDASGNWTQPAQ